VIAIHLTREGAALAGIDVGDGPVLAFQHGLGGDEAQVAEVIPHGLCRRLTLECRAHGLSQAGDPSRFSLATFADDILAFLDRRGVQRFAVGGVSMGAALALRIAVQNPARATALILGRPAWLWDRAPANMQPFVEVAHCLARGGREAFEASPTARALSVAAPDNLASLLKFFDRPDSAIASQLLNAIAIDGPGISETDLRELRLPTLVIGNAIDWVHPLDHAIKLAAVIPNARFVEITPKAANKPRHTEEFRAAVANFLKQEKISP
jgi:pimeloyl-ACP methyl ester carboxylesterase